LNNSHPTLYAPRTLAEIVDHAKLAYPANIAINDRWIAHYENRIAYERVLLEEVGATDLLMPKPRRELMPLLNYRATGRSITTENLYDRGRQITYPQVEMTQAEYVAINKDYRAARLGPDKLHRFRTAMIKHSLVSVFLTDSKEHAEPKPAEPKEIEGLPPTERAPRIVGYAAPQPRFDDPKDAEFQALREQVKTGVQVVTAAQLFPTPRDLAEQSVELAGDRADTPRPGAKRWNRRIIGRHLQRGGRPSGGRRD
jgi:hypothetical protein